jgi:O6-methylguanine-DNA--protein-cysteine methyltransferase
VIGKDGSLVGFGGGLSCKQWLLAHEASVLAGDGAFVRA